MISRGETYHQNLGAPRFWRLGSIHNTFRRKFGSVHFFLGKKKRHKNATGLRPIYVIFFEFLPISFQMKHNDDMRL